MASELMHTIEAIGREKGLDPEVIILAMEEAYAAASRKYYRSHEEFGASFDPDTGEFTIFSKQTVVELPLGETDVGEIRVGEMVVGAETDSLRG